MRSILIISLLIINLIHCQNAYAYFDPGNGGYLLAALGGYLWGLIVFMFSTVVIFFKKTVGSVWGKYKFVFSAVVICIIIIGTSLIVIKPWATVNKGSPARVSMEDAAYSEGAVFSHDPGRTSDGYFYHHGSLYDKEGKIVHSWTRKNFYGDMGVIDKNGDLYAASKYDQGYWGKFAWDGRVLWKKRLPIHHELLMDNDKLYVFTKETKRYRGRDVMFDAIRVFDKNGNPLEQWSTWDALKELHKHHGPVLLDIPFIPIARDPQVIGRGSLHGAEYEYYHLNSLQIIPPNSRGKEKEFFRPGNWLISFKNLSMIAILDKDTKKVLWSVAAGDIKNNLDGQHSPQMLPDGNIVIFDNGAQRKWSRVIVIDPVTRNIVWEFTYKGFFSKYLGYVQPLPNGSFLITESLNRHILEVTRDKKIVWEYFKKHSLGPHIYRSVEYPKEYIQPLLEKYDSGK